VAAFDAGFERKLISIGRMRSMNCRAVREIAIPPRVMPTETSAPEKVWFQPPQLLGYPCLSSRASFFRVAALEDWHEDIPGQ
jgi:hypothetical protein